MSDEDSRLAQAVLYLLLGVAVFGPAVVGYALGSTFQDPSFNHWPELGTVVGLAFGVYALLTVPTEAEAYGRRAGE